MSSFILIKLATAAGCEIFAIWALLLVMAMEIYEGEEKFSVTCTVGASARMVASSISICGFGH